MWWLIAIAPWCLLLPGLEATGQHVFYKPGTEYIYKYEGMLMTGFPELKDEHAGVTMAGQLTLQVLDETNYLMMIKQLRYSNITAGKEKEFSHKSSSNIHEIDIPAGFAASIELPIKFTMKDDLIYNIKLSEDEPQWSLNIKKALISTLKIALPTSWTEKHSSSAPRLPHWKVMEEGVDGKCENFYQYHRIHLHQLTDDEKSTVNSEFCKGKQFYRLIKSRDFDKCLYTSVYGTQEPSAYRCQHGNCYNLWSRSQVIHYIGCGYSQDSVTLQGILKEGNIFENLVAANKQNVNSKSKQILIFQEARTSLSPVPAVPNMIEIHELTHEYPGNIGLKDSDLFAQGVNSNASNSNQQGLNNELIGSKLSPDVLLDSLFEELVNIGNDLGKSENLNKRHVSQRIQSVSKVMSLLSTSHMHQLLTRVKQYGDPALQQRVKQLMIDLATTSGTNPGLMFLLDLMKAEELNFLQALLSITSITHYIKTPTSEIVDAIFNMTRFPYILKHQFLRSNLDLTFANLLYKVCLDDYHIYRYPINVYGDFCKASSSPLLEKYIPYFVDKLKTATDEKQIKAALMNIGILGHESTLPNIIEYLATVEEGSGFEIKRTAIYSISLIAKDEFSKFSSFFLQYILNPEEETSVRSAALSLLLRNNPDLTILQSIAASTWEEKNQHFHTFVYSTLENLANLNINNDKMSLSLKTLKTLAETVLPLAKQPVEMISEDQTMFISKWSDELQRGYLLQSHYSKITPSVYYYSKMVHFLENLKLLDYETFTQIRGKKKIVNNLISKLFKVDLLRSDRGQHDLEKQSPNVIAWLKLYTDIHIAFNFNSEDIEQLLESFIGGLQSGSYCGNQKIDFFKYNDFKQVEVFIPSDLGLPKLVEIHSPAITFITLTLNVECSANIPKISISGHIKQTLSQNAYAGTVCPFTGSLLAAGNDEQLSIHVPLDIQFGIQNGKIHLTAGPGNQSDNRDPITIFEYFSKPFTASKLVEFFDFNPISIGKDVNIIRVADRTNSQEIEFGAEFGLDSKIDIETDSVTSNALSQANLEKISYDPFDVFYIMEYMITSKPAMTYKKLSYEINTYDNNNHISVELGPLQMVQKGNEKEYVVPAHYSIGKNLDSPAKEFNFYFKNVDNGRSSNSWSLQLFEHRLKAQQVSKLYLNINTQTNDNLKDSEKLWTFKMGKSESTTAVISKMSMKVSEVQKAFSSSSFESKQCSKFMEIMKSSIETNQSMPSSAIDLTPLMKKQHYYCSRAQSQAKSIDNIKISVDIHDDGLHSYMATWHSQLKSMLAWHLEEEKSQEIDHDWQLEINIDQRQMNSDIAIGKNNGILEKYTDIPIPNYLKPFLPMTDAGNWLQKLYTQIYGAKPYDECLLSYKSAVSYHYAQVSLKEKTLIDIDSDCSRLNVYSIKARLDATNVSLTLQHGYYNISVQLDWFQPEKYTVTVGSRVFSSSQDKEVVIDDENFKFSLKVQKGIIEISLPSHNIAFDGATIALRPSNLYQILPACGLCHATHTSAIDNSVKPSINDANIIPSNVVSTFRNQYDQCTHQTHIMMYIGRMKCFSQSAVVQCRQWCRNGSHETRKLKFTCMPDDIQALNIEKLINNQVVPELSRRLTHVIADVKIPLQC